MVGMIRQEQLIESLKTVRQHTAQAVEDMPATALDFRPVPDVMTFREIAHHILDAGHGLLGLMLSSDDNFATPDFRERVKAFQSGLPAEASQAELAARLRSAMDERVKELLAQSGEFFSHIITRFDRQRVTRLEMAQMVKEHEMTHRAQLFLYLRLNGVVPSTTRQRLASQQSQQQSK
jgi:uncharacterized damage-inducible protein DinB